MPGYCREQNPELGAIPKEALADAPWCPLDWHHGRMQIRSAKKGGQFWGCPNYPSCAATRRPGERGHMDARWGYHPEWQT